MGKEHKKNKTYPLSLIFRDSITKLAEMFRYLPFFLVCLCSNAELPQSQFTLEKRDFTICYDGRLKQASWVIERITAESIKGDIERGKFSFKEDKQLPKAVRASLLDYKGSGYDAGHLSPSSHHRANKCKMEDGFLLSNASPQVPSFNRGYWSKLEKHVRELLKDNESVTIITGPLFLAQIGKDGKKRVTYEVIGESEIAVPTHFFKVIQTEKTSEAYILPNKKISAEKPLLDFKTTLEKVERSAGLVIPVRKN